MTQAAILAASGSPGTTTGFKNRIINGNMIISQRNGTAATSQTNGSYNLDRWSSSSYTGGSTTGKFTVTQSSTAPAGFTNSLLVTASTATSTSATDIYTLLQQIEGYNIGDLAWGTANGKTVTLSFWVRSSATGTFGGNIRNQNGDWSYPFTYTISSSNTFEYKTITIPPPTTGSTWQTDNTSGLYVWFNIQVGTNFSLSATGSWQNSGAYGASGCVNLLNNSGATLYLTGVQLEVGTTATNFDFRSITTELQLCQRYLPCFTIGGGNNVAVGTNFQSGNFITSMVLPVPARVAPTGVVYNGTITSCIVYTNGTGVAATGISWNGGTPSTVSFNISSGATPAGYGALWSASGANVSLYFTGCEL